MFNIFSIFLRNEEYSILVFLKLNHLLLQNKPSNNLPALTTSIKVKNKKMQYVFLLTILMHVLLLSFQNMSYNQIKKSNLLI